MQRYAVALGAGCAAAFLFAVGAETSPLAMALAYLAPLPIMIATMGWGLVAGAIAAGASVAGLGVIVEPLAGLLYASALAIPAWALAAFVVTPFGRYLPARLSQPQAHPSPGAIVTLAAIIGMLGAAALLTTMIVAFRGSGDVATAVAERLAAMAGDAIEPGGDEVKALAEALARYGPAAVAASTLLMLCINLYAAARSVQLSHRLARPWPDLPSSFAAPAPLAILALVCAGGAWALPPPASQFAGVVAGGLGGVFVFQGLAVAHALSRGLKLRTLMLAALYACCVLRAAYTLPVLALIGVVDAFVRVRARAALPSAKPKLHN